jgi:hypothetical protein
MHDDKSDVLKKIEQAVESMKKRLFDIKKQENPSLDWKKFSKDFDSMKDKSDALLKNKLFKEEIEKIIQAETNSDNKFLLNELKDTINFESIDESKGMPLFLSNILLLLTRFAAFYFISVITFCLFSSFIVVPIYYIFLLSLSMSLLFMLCDMPSKSIRAFIYDPFLSYKLIIILVIITMFVNHEFYQIFESSIIWMIYIPLCMFLHNILGRNIHKIWWRY